MSKHTIEELREMQSYPLSIKVALTQDRIRGWVREYGESGVFVSFSGGKDSTVLLDIARKMYPDMKAAYVDTGLEFPEIRRFVKSFDNVDWLKPKMNFRQVIEKYGYPFISKEVSEAVYDARKALNAGKTDTVRIRRIYGLEEYADSVYNNTRYQFFLKNDAPWISSKCCGVMKKGPLHDYQKKTGRNPITAQFADESRLRTEKWLQNGCNGFDLKSPISNPMSFWTDQDVLWYIKENHLPICSVYGDIVIDYQKQIEGQQNLSDYGLYDEKPRLKTTGQQRTGCVFCGYGCHLEKSPNRFELLKESHPQLYDYVMRPWEKGGLNYKEVIDWINENGNLNIKY